MEDWGLNTEYYGNEAATVGSSAPVDSGSGGGFLSGIGGLLGYAGKVFTDVKASEARAKIATQYSPYGVPYWEGQRIAGRGMQYPAAISPMMLLLIGGAALLILKDK